MSFVYFLDVFDPEGLPDGLPDQAAAEHQRGRRLSQPSPKLIQLLGAIRSKVTSATVNVVGGEEELPVEWQAGPPPTVSGAGASCALWSLILPVEERVNEIEEVVPQLVVWAMQLGLRTYDAQQQAVGVGRPSQAAAVGGASEQRPVKARAPGECVDILIQDAHAFFSCMGGSIPGLLAAKPGRTLAEACAIFMQGKKLDRPYGAHLRRLITLAERAFPYDQYGDTLWCGKHPLHDPVHSSDGVRVIRVAGGDVDKVLSHILPAARELFLTVAVPDQDFYVHREFNSSEFRTNLESRLATLDKDWRVHRTSRDAVNSKFQEALRVKLAPHGFSDFSEKGAWYFAFVRRLFDEQVLQVLSYGGSGFQVRVYSERFWRMRAAQFQDIRLVQLPIVDVNFETIRQSYSADWRGCGASAPASQAMIDFALEDVEALVLPMLDKLRCASDLWEWFMEDGRVPGGREIPGFRSLQRFQDFVNESPRTYGLIYGFYVARCLPDGPFFELLDAWEISSARLPNDKRLEDMRELVQMLRDMPQTPPDAPL